MKYLPVVLLTCSLANASTIDVTLDAEQVSIVEELKQLGTPGYEGNGLVTQNYALLRREVLEGLLSKARNLEMTLRLVQAIRQEELQLLQDKLNSCRKSL